MNLFRWTYYLTPRMVLGSVFALFLSYGALAFYNQALMPGHGGLAFELTLVMVILGFAGGWILWSAAGRAQLKYFLTRADIAAGERDYHKGSELYRKARGILASSHFPPKHKGSDAILFLNDYAEFLCAAGSKNREALEVYDSYLRISPSDKSFARSVIPLVIASDDIERERLPLLSRLHRLAPDDRVFADFAAAQFLNNEIYSAESQEILLEAVRRGSELKTRSLKFLLPRMLEQDRRDPRALEVYLEAFRSGVEHRELKSTLGRIAHRARSEAEPGPLTALVIKVFDSLSPEEREEISAAIRLEKPAVPAAELETELGVPVETKPESTKRLEAEAEPHLRAGRAAEPELEFRAGDFSPYRAKMERAAGIFGGLFSLFKAGMTLVWSGVCAVVRTTGAHWGIVRWILLGGLSLTVIIGLTRIVINLGGPPSSEEVSLQVVSDKPFTIQVAAFKERERAEKLIRQLDKAGLKTYLVTSIGETSTWHQVRTGHFNSNTEAKQAAEELLRQKIITGYFIANFQPGTYVD